MDHLNSGSPLCFRALSDFIKGCRWLVCLVFIRPVFVVHNNKPQFSTTLEAKNSGYAESPAGEREASARDNREQRIHYRVVPITCAVSSFLSSCRFELADSVVSRPLARLFAGLINP